MAHGAIKEKGVLPPEKLGMDEKLFEKFIAEMKKRGISITEKETA
jgi:saccharopine dehydrogenase-like NADP-dependent oxidoreductase